MKPILPYLTRCKVMGCLEQGIFETVAIIDEIILEAEQYVSSQEQLKRCVSAIKGKFAQGFSPKKFGGIF